MKPAGCEYLEYCSAYMLGSLDKRDLELLEAHLLEGCSACDAEIASLGDSMLKAGQSAGVSPSDELMPGILDRIRGIKSDDHAATQVWKSWKPTEDRSGLLTVRSGEGEWSETSIAGISAKPLHSDPEKKSVTMLIKMAAGTRYPSHRHGGAEECFVIEGDLHVGEKVLHPGDYQRAVDNSIHVEQWTETGCLLFIVSSTEDEILG